jgi:asparagine synthase (glutamine-hydrolysing)
MQRQSQNIWGTEHTELYVSSAEALDVIPLLGKMFDEPFADSSQIPTYLVSKMAKQYVSVSLSGDAGDELFCGYNSYMLADTWQKIQFIPFLARKQIGNFIKMIPATSWECFFNKLGKIKKLPSNMGEKIEKLAARLQTIDCINLLYYSLASQTDNPENLVVGSKEPQGWIKKIGHTMKFEDIKHHMMLMDTMTYLPDDILVKVDRAAMANSLETRVPFLDHRVVELAWRMPIDMKFRDNQTKWLLRQVLYQYVPKKLIERPKVGFSIPLAQWLRGPLRGWVENLLDEKRLNNEGYFNANNVRDLWHAHLSGKRNHQAILWSILMFQNWLEASE